MLRLLVLALCAAVVAAQLGGLGGLLESFVGGGGNQGVNRGRRASTYQLLIS